ncbi:response regulator transcription factor [Peribacillus acanthi]|uniref:response regulator transcription factor n=1 Tax=Peribacillus acanthi TaxID=2171554 RepID=UPI000D3E7B66|nr:response regulator transcription factor [Peribacillus acanthi]
MKTVLLVDDEKRMLDLLELNMVPTGFKCIKKQAGKDAISFLETEHADLVILDIMMPDMDGWQTCKNIREFSDVPIIMLTARDDKEDIVKGLRLGADDYITKPFNEEELVARITAVMRRAKNDKEEVRRFKGLVLDRTAFECTFKTQRISLTPKEFSLLELLISHPNKVFTRDHLLSTIWNFKSDVEDRTIDSHIRNVRDKLRQVGFPVDEYLKTVWGVGYKWSSDSEK